MNDHSEVLAPIGAPAQAQRAQVRFPSDLRGKVVGFVDNAKPNFNHLAADMAERLTAEFGVAGTLIHRKRAASVPAPEAMVEEIAAKCDLVITGSGD